MGLKEKKWDKIQSLKENTYIDAIQRTLNGFQLFGMQHHFLQSQHLQIYTAIRFIESQEIIIDPEISSVATYD